SNVGGLFGECIACSSRLAIFPITTPKGSSAHCSGGTMSVAALPPAHFTAAASPLHLVAPLDESFSEANILKGRRGSRLSAAFCGGWQHRVRCPDGLARCARAGLPSSG